MTESVIKHCDASGRWNGKDATDFDLVQGWTNYTPCFTPELQELMKELYSGSEEDAQVIQNCLLRIELA